MPIPTDEWRLLIRVALYRLSDKEFQKLAWFNRHSEQTSPEEQICQILDDYGFEDFISCPRVGLSPWQQQAASMLVRKLKNFGGVNSGPFDPHKVIDDSEWDSIREESKTVLAILFPE